MSKPQDILNQIITQLQGASCLSYVDDTFILKGRRQSINNFPAIVVVPSGAVEESYAYPLERIKYRFDILGFIKTHDKDAYITGNGSTIKGIMDIENDIKLALDSDRTLSGYAIHTDIIGSENDTVDSVVEVTIVSVEVLFQQTMNVRT